MNNLNSANKEFKNILKKRNMLSDTMGEDISESWMRCISTGLDPFKDPKQSLVSSVELKQIKEKNEALRKIVIPEIELLYSQIAGTNFMVAYSDENGLVLDTIYDKTCLQGDVGKSVIPGSIWAEKVCGTNGLGLSVELKKPTIVSGKEHFFIAHEKISCFASPIINYDGKTIGIIDASTDSKSREQHTLALVKLATRSIETKLFIQKFSSELILSFHPRSEYLSTTSVGLLAINGDGVVVGANNDDSLNLMRQLYSPFTVSSDRFIEMDIRSAEMTKYAANSMLATKISFINEISNICERVGADVNQVRKGIGSDSRIGYKFIYPGCGYGGSCFPKDVQALINIANNHGYKPSLISSVERVNKAQKEVLFSKLTSQFGSDLSGKSIAVWGLSFKPETDDMREAPSINLIKSIVSAGGSVNAYDPKAIKEAQFYLDGIPVNYFDDNETNNLDETKYKRKNNNFYL